MKKTKQNNKNTRLSKRLAIWSICLFWVPFVDILLAGLSVSHLKESDNESRDKTLIIIALFLSIIYMIYYAHYFGIF